MMREMVGGMRLIVIQIHGYLNKPASPDILDSLIDPRALKTIR